MMLCPSQCLMPGGTWSRFALFLVMSTSITSQDGVCQVSPMKLTVYLINSIFREVLYTHPVAPQPSPTRFSTYWRFLPKSTIIMCLLNGDFLGPSLTPHSLVDVLL